jgi:hypothetical protein
MALRKRCTEFRAAGRINGGEKRVSLRACVDGSCGRRALPGRASPALAPTSREEDNVLSPHPETHLQFHRRRQGELEQKARLLQLALQDIPANRRGRRRSQLHLVRALLRPASDAE